MAGKKKTVKKASPFEKAFKGMTDSGLTRKSPIFIDSDKTSFARLVVHNKLWFGSSVLDGAQKYLAK